MRPLTDAAVARLRSVATWPEFASGRYSVTEQIGRGGMGTVYLAHDTELGREVAIKVPHVAVSSTLEQRLQTEARVLARLEHPGIVPIHDVGRLADGRLFYVMKRVHGQTLRDYLPICSYCRKIRNDENYWQNVESYITSQTGTQFSHGICPSCYTTVMDEHLASRAADRQATSGDAASRDTA